MGVGNTIATIPSYICPLLCAHVLDVYGRDQGWEVIFSGMAAAAAMSAAVYASLVKVVPVDCRIKEA